MTLALKLLGEWFVFSCLLGIAVGKTIRFGQRAVLVAACLCFASSASAQEIKPDWTAYTVMVTGNVADLWTTKAAFDAGAREGNGLTTTSRIAPLALSKVSAVVGIGLAMRLLEQHGHPRIAKALGFVDGGVTFGAAVHNRRVAR